MTFNTEISDELLMEVGTTKKHQVWFTRPETKLYGDLVYRDIIRVLAAHALQNGSALDAFVAISNIFDDEK